MQTERKSGTVRPATSFGCTICQSTFGRLEHLQRHTIASRKCQPVSIKSFTHERRRLIRAPLSLHVLRAVFRSPRCAFAASQVMQIEVIHRTFRSKHPDDSTRPKKEIMRCLCAFEASLQWHPTVSLLCASQAELLLHGLVCSRQA